MLNTDSSSSAKLVAKYLGLTLEEMRSVSHVTIVWAYLSKRVKEHYGKETTWTGDGELAFLFFDIQREDETFLNNFLHKFADIPYTAGNHDSGEDLNTNLIGEHYE